MKVRKTPLLLFLLLLFSANAISQDSTEKYIYLKTNPLKYLAREFNIAYEMPLNSKNNIEISASYLARYWYYTPYYIPEGVNAAGFTFGIHYKQLYQGLKKRLAYAGPAIKFKYLRSAEHSFYCYDCYATESGIQRTISLLLEYQIGYFTSNRRFEPHLGLGLAIKKNTENIHHFEDYNPSTNAYYDNLKKVSMNVVPHITLGLNIVGFKIPYTKNYIFKERENNERDEPVEHRKNAIFVEWAGNSGWGLYSINFDKRFFVGNDGLGMNIGAGYLPLINRAESDQEQYVIQGMLNYLIGNGRLFVELGAGYNYEYYNRKDHVDRMNRISGMIGLRLQPNESNVMLRLNFVYFMEIFNFQNGQNYLLPGASIGYIF